MGAFGIVANATGAAVTELEIIFYGLVATGTSFKNVLGMEKMKLTMEAIEMVDEEENERINEALEYTREELLARWDGPQSAIFSGLPSPPPEETLNCRLVMMLEVTYSLPVVTPLMPTISAGYTGQSIQSSSQDFFH